MVIDIIWNLRRISIKLKIDLLMEELKQCKTLNEVDFITDYNSYKGNAYGLANTLTQTAFLRPKIKSDKVKNLFFTGQLTVPGPGVPPSIISGKIVSQMVIKNATTKIKSIKKNYETAI